MGQCIIMTGGYAGDDSDDCTAVKSQVLTGYKAITKDSDDDAVTGTMPERGAWTGSVGMNGSVIIPDGHHSGTGKVNGPSVTQRGAWTSGIGINGKVLIPEGYHNGQGYVNQSIATLGGQTITPSATQQTVSCSGKYMTGNIVINGYSAKTYSIMEQPEVDIFQGMVDFTNDSARNKFVSYPCEKTTILLCEVRINTVEDYYGNDILQCNHIAAYSKESINGFRNSDTWFGPNGKFVFSSQYLTDRHYFHVTNYSGVNRKYYVRIKVRTIFKHM